MAEIDLNLPTPGGSRGFWDTMLNASLNVVEDVLNDIDVRVDAAAGDVTAEAAARAAADAGLQTQIDAIPDGPPGPPGGSDEAFAEWVEDPASLTNAAVTAQNLKDIALTYNSDDNVLTVTDGGAVTTFTYDIDGDVDTDSTVIGSTTITRQYTYDGQKRLVSIEEI